MKGKDKPQHEPKKKPGEFHKEPLRKLRKRLDAAPTLGSGSPTRRVTMIQLFLGGTVGGNNWRDNFITTLTKNGVPADAIFNPVVKEWNAEAQANEEKAKAEAKYMMFFLGDPKQDANPISAYSMVEATMALYDKPETTIVVFDKTPFNGHLLKAMNQTEKVLRKRFPEAMIFGSVEEAADWFSTKLRQAA